MPKMTDKQEDAVRRIYHSALDIAQQAFFCMAEVRAGREWLLKIQHANERIALMLDRLEKD